MSQTLTICEKCCEELAGNPPEIDYPQEVFYRLALLAHLLIGFAWGLAQVIGGVCFFLVAMWFVPICGPMSKKELAEKAWKEREDRKWRERKMENERKDAEENEWWNRKEQEEQKYQAELQSKYAAELNKEIAYFEQGSHELKKDDRNVEEFNNIGRTVAEGKMDPLKGIQLQAQYAEEIKDDRREEEKKQR